MVHASWKESIENSYMALDEAYRQYLETDESYFPDRENCFNAFKNIPKCKVRYILFGQDPYPREESATGHAFIDGKVSHIFSETGLSKEVNRATSLRNFIKMILVARGNLAPADTSQQAIAALKRDGLIENIDQLRDNLEENGVLLLNTALVFSSKEESRWHIREWQPFIEKLLSTLHEVKPTLILFGAHAKALKKLKGVEKFDSIEMEHPYNYTFINNPEALNLFGPMDLLAK